MTKRNGIAIFIALFLATLLSMPLISYADCGSHHKAACKKHCANSKEKNCVTDCKCSMKCKNSKDKDCLKNCKEEHCKMHCVDSKEKTCMDDCAGKN